MNRVAVVTGGSRGIGRAIVERLSRSGFSVVFSYNNSEKEAHEICESFNDVFSFKADVSKEDDVRKLVDFAIDKFGRVDLLVNNAGIDLIKTITDTSTEEFDNVLKTNLYSAFWASKEISKIMINQKDGLIINISSIWGQVGASCEMAYSVSKAGMDAITKSLAKELGPSNIRVNSIAPGIINTSMNDFLNEDEKKEIISEIPLGRIGEPADVADVVEMLVKCTYITGQVINVNGNWII